jgi:hypothetical protein
MLGRVCLKQNATNQEPVKSNQSSPTPGPFPMYTHRKEIPNPMSNKNFVFDNFCDSFLNIHKLWRYPQGE